MKGNNIVCPCCGAEHTIESLLVDEALRDFFNALVKLPQSLQLPMTRYINLFRKKRPLTSDKKLKILNEVMALVSDEHSIEVIEIAVNKTVENLMGKESALDSQGYLKRVLEGIAVPQQTGIAKIENTHTAPPPPRSQSKAQEAFARLQQLKEHEIQSA